MKSPTASPRRAKSVLRSLARVAELAAAEHRVGEFVMKRSASDSVAPWRLLSARSGKAENWPSPARRRCEAVAWSRLLVLDLCGVARRAGHAEETGRCVSVDDESDRQSFRFFADLSFGRYP